MLVVIQDACCYLLDISGCLLFFLRSFGILGVDFWWLLNVFVFISPTLLDAYRSF